MRASGATVQHRIVPLAAVAAWEIFGSAGFLPRYLATPSAILAALGEIARTGELFVALGVSLYRVAIGFAFGTASGIVVGVAAGVMPSVRHFFDPLVAFLFAVPKIAFLPIFLLLLGLGNGSKIAIIAFSCFFPVF